ncbi:MAG: PA2169 family four-helix-bundle protein [Planctomycetota bacterium]
METVRDLDKSTIDGLQKLCKLCHDSTEGYRTAASELDSEPLSEAFRNTSVDRAMMRDQLAEMLGTSHEDIPDGGTALGSVHRWWIEARTAISSNDDKAVVSEAIRGENSIEDEYKDVLSDAGDSPVSETLRAHLLSIHNCRQTLEELERMQDS